MAPSSDNQPRLRIGELARRVGVAPELLRAWESRYGLLSPERSPGGFRLYSGDDERRVRRMQRHLAEGLSAAEAARLALGAEAAGENAAAGGSGIAAAAATDAAARELGAAIDEFDGARAHELLDRLIASYTIETVLRDVVLPYLHDLGERWSLGQTTVAHEHFASTLLEGRLLGLGRGWDAGSGPRAVLACPSGERHTLGLISFGLALRRQGWRITYLGAETPTLHLVDAADALAPDVIVLSGVAPQPIATAIERLAELNGGRRVVVGGAAASSPAAERLGWETLPQDPVAAAAALR